MSDYNKYFKYKYKYLELKKMIGAGEIKYLHHPNIKGDKALANTPPACNKAFTVPKLSTPYNSAQSAPRNGADIPKFNPNILIYKI